MGSWGKRLCELLNLTIKRYSQYFIYKFLLKNLPILLFSTSNISQMLHLWQSLVFRNQLILYSGRGWEFSGPHISPVHQNSKISLQYVTDLFFLFFFTRSLQNSKENQSVTSNNQHFAYTPKLLSLSLLNCIQRYNLIPMEN